MFDSEPEVIRYQLEVNDKLAELGLTQPPLLRALSAGVDFTDTLTQNDTLPIRGIGKWNAIIVMLREELKAFRWSKTKEAGDYGLTMNASGEIGIMVVSGDKNTGRRGTPTNAFPLRRNARKAVRDNQLALQWEQGHFLDAVENKTPPLTYFLLHHINSDDDRIRAELSLPVSIREQYVADWHPRIILPSPREMSVTQQPIVSPRDESPYGDDIDIDIGVIEEQA